ncbi:periplasmic nitrate reductase, NapE protein [Algibacillus agarilyticus]|uniref:periplasmic nitrate reductase, NapE protein n=1 Tax=Algibacillus agarilyticus TaxID=2234133 RepID=UPI000DCFD1A4|nr:periplasmic nitrate reductase, NapE protein [Algibacillus agarilyticus]
MSKESDQITKKYEFSVFLFITVVLFPLLSIILVSGYGFSIWMMQLLFGPTTY